MDSTHGGETLGSSSSAATGDSDDKPSSKSPKVHTSFRISPVVEMFSKMRGEKEKLLKEIGLHGLTQLPRGELMSNRSFNCQFAFWLLQRVNCEDGSLDLGLRGTLQVRSEDVNYVIGVPCSGEELKKSDPLMIHETKQSMKKLLLLKPEDELNLLNVKNVLEREINKESGDAARKAFVTASYIFAVSYFLAPKGRPAKVNTEVLECLLTNDQVSNINWGSYVLLTLREASEKLKKKVSARTKSVTLDGCLLLLQVVYLDNLDFGATSTVHSSVPRVKDFSFEVLDKLINADKAKKGGPGAPQFGERKLRGEEYSSYTRGDLYRAILRSKERIASGLFFQSDRQQILSYLKKNIEDGKRKIRLASREFENQLCEAMDQSQRNIISLLDIWISANSNAEAKQRNYVDGNTRSDVHDSGGSIGAVFAVSEERGVGGEDSLAEACDAGAASPGMKKQRKRPRKVLSHKVKKGMKRDGEETSSPRGGGSLHGQCSLQG